LPTTRKEHVADPARLDDQHGWLDPCADASVRERGPPSAVSEAGALMSGVRNVFACLVHESPECVLDLVRNLRDLDAGSLILLYNGGRDPRLLSGCVPFEQYGAVVHPNPQPQSWGRLHGFALDCMQYVIEQGPFDALTIVDSDQLGVRPGYSAFL